MYVNVQKCIFGSKNGCKIHIETSKQIAHIFEYGSMDGF